MSVTREKIMQLGEELILTKGFNAFSYQDISSELGIKNAAIHYYFPSKGNLGSSIVRNNIQRFEEMVENMLAHDFDEWQQLDTFLKIYLKSNREDKICLMGSLGPDFHTLNDNTQKELKKMTNLILLWLSKLLEQGQKKGLFFFKGEAELKALQIISSMIGGLQIARIAGKQSFKSLYQQILDELK